jgi:hypothetical protein
MPHDHAENASLNLCTLSINCESRNTKLNRQGFSEYKHLEKTNNRPVSLDLLLALV